MKKKILLVCIAIITFLVALVITLYPIISTRYNEIHQSEIHTAYQEQVKQADTSAIDEARELARQYNESIKPGVRQVDSFSYEAILLAAGNYAHQLNVTGNGIMGYVEIPSISVTLPIYHGTEDAR